jgi:hypothetical protein
MVNAMQRDQLYNVIRPSSGTSASSVDLNVSGVLVKSLPNNAAQFSFNFGKQDQFNIVWNDGTQTQIAAKNAAATLDYIQKTDLGTKVVMKVSGQKISGNIGGYFERNNTYYILAYNLSDAATSQSDVTLNIRFSNVN